jgi:hypothetical protein
MRRVAALAVLVHLIALIISGLPRSRFKDGAGLLSERYVALTGQQQEWGMYHRVSRSRSDYELLAELPGGRTERPWGTAAEMDARRLYLIEALFVSADGGALGERLLDVLHARWETEPAPTRLRVRRESTSITEYGKLPRRRPAPERRTAEIEGSF